MVPPNLHLAHFHKDLMEHCVPQAQKILFPKQCFRKTHIHQKEHERFLDKYSSRIVLSALMVYLPNLISSPLCLWPSLSPSLPLSPNLMQNMTTFLFLWSTSCKLESISIFYDPLLLYETLLTMVKKFLYSKFISHFCSCFLFHISEADKLTL